MRVVLAEDEVLLREGLARLLDEAGFTVVARCSTAAELLLRARSFEPDVAVVDIRLPPTFTDEGIRAAHELRARHTGTGVLVLSQYREPGLAMKLFGDSAGGLGYLLKDRIDELDELTAAVRTVSEGGCVLAPAIVAELVARRRREDPLANISAREREVLELMAQGRSNRAIAERLVLTVGAVAKHVTTLCNKLGIAATADDHRRVLAVLAFLRS
jgi:DNA-binding NarL/FixJ family response regulator